MEENVKQTHSIPRTPAADEINALRPFNAFQLQILPWALGQRMWCNLGIFAGGV